MKKTASAVSSRRFRELSTLSCQTFFQFKNKKIYDFWSCPAFWAAIGSSFFGKVE